eukprot:5680486-Pyramimonas_sp.AAC.1
MSGPRAAETYLKGPLDFLEAPPCPQIRYRTKFLPAPSITVPGAKLMNMRMEVREARYGQTDGATRLSPRTQ